MGSGELKIHAKLCGTLQKDCDSHSLMISVKDSRAETSGEVSMGGDGSGRRYDSKATTADYCHFDVRRWQRKGLLVKDFQQAVSTALMVFNDVIFRVGIESGTFKANA